MYVPIEIIRPILLKLTVQALIRSQCVCKEWRSIIQHPHFKLSYRGQRRMLVAAFYDSLDVTSITNTSLPIKTLLQLPENASLHHLWTGVWCSCNGLVLFSMGKHILLWNPSTRCCTKVLELPRLSRTFPDDVVSGLCYVSSSGDYKVVLLFCVGFDDNVMVASLKNKEWRKVSYPYREYSSRMGVNFRNTLHWRAISWTRRPHTIIYFKAESDEFKELPTPESHTYLERSIILGLGIIDGCLCMVCGGNEAEEKLQVWVMKEYGVKESWVSQFVISAPATELFNFSHITTLYSSKCNTKVLICRCYKGSRQILVFDVKNNKLQDNHFSAGESKYYSNAAILSYVESIVSPHEFIWRDDEHKLPGGVDVYFENV